MYKAFTSKIQKVFNVDAQYFMSGGFWLLLAQAVSVLTSLGVTVLFASSLTEVDYGIYRYIVGLAILLSAFSLTGSAQAIMQASARGYQKFLTLSTPMTLLYGLGISVIASGAALYYFINNNSILAAGCLLIALFQPVTQLFLNAQSSFYGQTKFIPGAGIQILKATMVSLSSVIALLLTQDLLWLLATYFVSQAVAALVSYQYASKKVDLAQEVAPEEKQSSLSYAKHSSLRNWFVHFSSQFDSIFVFQQLGAAELALYSISTLLPGHIRGTFKNLQTLLIPKYSKHENWETLRKFIPKRSFQFFILLCVLTAAFVMITPFLYSFLFPNYPEAVQYVQLLALSFPASVSLIPFGAMQALRMEKKLYWFQISSSLFQVFAAILLTVIFGLIGAVIARVAAQYFRMLSAFFLLFR